MGGKQLTLTGHLDYQLLATALQMNILNARTYLPSTFQCEPDGPLLSSRKDPGEAITQLVLFVLSEPAQVSCAPYALREYLAHGSSASGETLRRFFRRSSSLSEPTERLELVISYSPISHSTGVVSTSRGGEGVDIRVPALLPELKTGFSAHAPSKYILPAQLTGTVTS